MEGPCLVLAGPGSGKTLTVVNRIKYLIEERNVRPEEILVITFTKFAAQEMKQRLKIQMEGKNLPVTMGTFHGIYYGILKWAYHLGPQNLLSEEGNTVFCFVKGKFSFPLLSISAEKFEKKGKGIKGYGFCLKR